MENNLSKRELNKLKKKEIIIDTAAKLFMLKDFEATSMDDISRESQYTKRTIYQYFSSKEDLFYAVALKGAKQYMSNYEEVLANEENALEKIRRLNREYYLFYLDNPGMSRIINYQPGNKLNCEASPNYRELEAFKNKLVKLYMDIIDEGKKDGSINAELSTKNASYFALLSSVGLMSIISAMESSFIWGKEGLNAHEFLPFSLDLLADALKHK